MVPHPLLPLLLAPWCNLDPLVNSVQDNPLHFFPRLHSALCPTLVFVGKVFWLQPSHPYPQSLSSSLIPTLEHPHFSCKEPPSRVAQVPPTTRQTCTHQSLHGRIYQKTLFFSLTRCLPMAPKLLLPHPPLCIIIQHLWTFLDILSVPQGELWTT